MDHVGARPLLGFAHRGGRHHSAENTLEAFVLAVRMGATAVETDIWLTRDGVVKIDHDGFGHRDGHKVRIGDVNADELPSHMPTLSDLYTAVGPKVDVSIDVKDSAAAQAALAVVAGYDVAALGKTWLCSPNMRVLTSWRALSPDVRLVASVKRRRVHTEAACAPETLAAKGIDALNLRGDTWTPGLIDRCHSVDLRAFAWNVQLPWQMRLLQSWGIDALYSDHTDRLVRFLNS